MGTTNNPQEHSRAKPQRSATANDFTSEGTKVGGLSLKQKLFRLKKVQTVQDNLDNNATENQFKVSHATPLGILRVRIKFFFYFSSYTSTTWFFSLDKSCLEYQL